MREEEQTRKVEKRDEERLCLSLSHFPYPHPRTFVTLTL